MCGLPATLFHINWVHEVLIHTNSGHFTFLFYGACFHTLFASDIDVMFSFSRYDGQRAQIHRLADGSVRVFSRNGDETTARFPDLVNIIQDSCGPAAATFIVDAEVSLFFGKCNMILWWVMGF